MKHVSLNGQEESVKRFILALAVEPEGSVLELDGRAVARMLPVSPKSNGTHAAAFEWTDAKNARRCVLVDRKIDGVLSLKEAEELADLQQQLLRYRDRVAPLPLEDTRRLHQELLAKAAAASKSHP